MLVVKFEVWKGGDPEDVEPLGVMLIRNTGHTDSANTEPDLFVYDVELQKTGRGRPMRARLQHWRRRGWETLVRKAAEEVLH